MGGAETVHGAGLGLAWTAQFAPSNLLPRGRTALQSVGANSMPDAPAVGVVLDEFDVYTVFDNRTGGWAGWLAYPAVVAPVSRRKSAKAGAGPPGSLAASSIRRKTEGILPQGLCREAAHRDRRQGATRPGLAVRADPPPMAAPRETSVVFAAARGAVFPGRRWGVRGPPAPS